MKDWLLFVWKDGPSFAMWLAVIGLVVVSGWSIVRLLGQG